MNFLKLFDKKSLIVAHRGASSVAPENTYLAMQESIGICDFIEIDVQLSSDGVAVVMHDSTLKRTTNVKKIDTFKDRHPYRVCDFTYDELTMLDYGRGEQLLTLENALQLIKENEFYLNIEIKDIKKSFSDKQVVSTVINEVQKAKLENQVLISSFRHEYLPLVKQISSKIATAVLVDTKHPKSLIKYLKSLDVECYYINKKLVSKKIVDKLKKEGFFVGVYVVNDKQEQKELFDIGVNAIFTDL